MNGYRLTGTNMGSWAGQRVQIVGVIIPAATGPSGSTGANGTPGTGQMLTEFRVQSVQPIDGTCPQP
jgi:hypothetical protein